MQGLSNLVRSIRQLVVGRDEPAETHRRPPPDPAGDRTLADGNGRKPEREHAEPSEQYIERLLAAAGGRLRQQAIIAATDLSPATVSRRLSTMETQGRIVRITLGREKVVCLPTAAPEPVDAVDEAARS